MLRICLHSFQVDLANGKRQPGKKVKDNYLDQHMLSEAHKAAEEMVYCFLKIRQPGTDIVAKLSKQNAEQQVRAKKGLLSIIDIIIRLGMRGVALRS